LTNSPQESLQESIAFCQRCNQSCELRRFGELVTLYCEIGRVGFLGIQLAGGLYLCPFPDIDSNFFNALILEVLAAAGRLEDFVSSLGKNAIIDPTVFDVLAQPSLKTATPRGQN
jgi:hypothetical protein